MDIIQRPTDHFDERKNGVKPDAIIIHYTETQTLEAAEDYFLGRTEHPTGGRVSIHYMIDYDGTVIQYVDDDKRAWHAGISHWAGVDDLNTYSIGIELVNPGRRYGYRAFTAAQMDSLLKLCKKLMSDYSISPHRILAHSDIAPARKSDPGELFDWKTMAQAGIGVWPQLEQEDREAARDYIRDEQSLKEAFVKAGYNPADELKDIIIAFQRHFYPEAFADQDKEQVGRMNETAAARLHWLVRNRHQL